MYFDTHVHLDDGRFDEDRQEIINLLKEEQVSLMINVGADLQSSQNSIALAKEHDFIYAAVGVHPHEAQSMKEEDLMTLKKWSKEPKVVAIGEIGLDYYYDHSPRDVQKYWFKRQLQLAQELGLPYIIHNRDAHKDTVDIIQEVGYYQGVFHCYSGSAEMARQLVKMGFYISLAGPVTFKNAPKVKEVASFVPLNRLLIETDCPYLTPEPFRGKRNNPAYVKYVTEEIAMLRETTPEEIAKTTKENGIRFFKIGEKR